MTIYRNRHVVVGANFSSDKIFVSHRKIGQLCHLLDKNFVLFHIQVFKNCERRGGAVGYISENKNVNEIKNEIGEIIYNRTRKDKELLFGCATANFRPLSRRQPHSPDVNNLRFTYSA